jgi:predicted transcriptional regulator
MELKELNHTDLISLCIFFGVADRAAIQVKLARLGFPIGRSTVSARISEMLRDGFLFSTSKENRYVLTDRGTDRAVEITSQLTDDQLAIIA